MEKSKKKPDPARTGLEGRIAYILMKAGVAGPEIDECIDWAFGPRAWYVPIYPDWIDRWHKLHPKAFRVKRGESFVEWIFVVGFMFAMEKKKSQFGKGDPNAKVR